MLKQLVFLRIWDMHSQGDIRILTNFSPDAIKDLVDNSQGYFVHTLIHEAIHRVTSFGREFQAFDVYDSDPKFDVLTLDEQLKTLIHILGFFFNCPSSVR